MHTRRKLFVHLGSGFGKQLCYGLITYKRGGETGLGFKSLNSPANCLTQALDVFVDVGQNEHKYRIVSEPELTTEGMIFNE